MRVESYEDLEIWQMGMTLVVGVYGLTDALPAKERFNLTSQLNRAAVSIPSNIAEGWGRGLSASQTQFIRIARGSLYEVRTQLEIVRRLGLVQVESLDPLRELTMTLGRKLNSYLSTLERQIVREQPTLYDAPTTNYP